MKKNKEFGWKEVGDMLHENEQIGRVLVWGFLAIIIVPALVWAICKLFIWRH